MHTGFLQRLWIVVQPDVLQGFFCAVHDNFAANMLEFLELVKILA